MYTGEYYRSMGRILKIDSKARHTIVNPMKLSLIARVRVGSLLEFAKTLAENITAVDYDNSLLESAVQSWNYSTTIFDEALADTLIYCRGVPPQDNQPGFVQFADRWSFAYLQPHSYLDFFPFSINLLSTTAIRPKIPNQVLENSQLPLDQSTVTVGQGHTFNIYNAEQYNQEKNL